jgi:hypothetical protein
MPFDEFAPDDEHQSLAFDSSGLEFALTPDQQPGIGFPESPIPPDGPTIDPAILDDNHSRDLGPAEQMATIPVGAAISRKFPVQHSHSPVRDAHHHSIQQDSLRPIQNGRQPAKISKLSVVIDNRPKKRASRPASGLGCKKVTLPTLRAQFSALPVEERVQFLSWLFEGALSHCLHLPHGSDQVPNSRFQHASTAAGLVSMGHAPCSRKGLSWSNEETDLLVKLREEESLAWSEVTEQFGRKFPGRSQGSLQVYWSTRLRKRQ